MRYKLLLLPSMIGINHLTSRGAQNADEWKRNAKVVFEGWLARP